MITLVDVPDATMKRARADVKRGAALLDATDWAAVLNAPGFADFQWRNAVELRELDMASTCYCVLGWIGARIGDDTSTTFGGRTRYSDVADLIGCLLNGDTYGFDIPRESGYWVGSESLNRDQYHELLAELWTEEITGVQE